MPKYLQLCSSINSSSRCAFYNNLQRPRFNGNLNEPALLCSSLQTIANCACQHYLGTGCAATVCLFNNLLPDSVGLMLEMYVQINGSLARAAMKELLEKGQIKAVAQHSKQQIYTRAIAAA